MKKSYARRKLARSLLRAGIGLAGGIILSHAMHDKEERAAYTAAASLILAGCAVDAMREHRQQEAQRAKRQEMFKALLREQALNN